MKKLLLILFMLSSARLFAVEQVEVFVAVTNAPVTGDTLVINGVTRTWTNAHSATTILTNYTVIRINNSATNLYFNLSKFTVADPQPVVIQNNTNQIRMIFAVNQSVTVTESGNWASITYTTNTITQAYAVRMPITIEATTNRTKIMSWLVSALEDSTNAIGYHWVVGSQFVGLTNNNAMTGTNSLTDGGWNRPRLTNVVALSGVMTALTNGYATNTVLDSPIMTNGVSYGSFRSPGTGTASEQLGTGASATGTSSTAIGNSSTASGNQSTAVGTQAEASGKGSVAIGEDTRAAVGASIAIGSGAVADATNSIAIGFESNVVVSHTNSIALGRSVTTTETNQIMLGTSTHKVRITGRLEVTGTITNIIATGSTKIGVSGGPYSTLSIARRNVTSMAAGANSLDIAGASYVKVSGAGASFSIDGITNSAAGNLDGAVLIIANLTGNSMTIANDSGLESTAANRINTTTGNSINFGTSGVASFIYDSAAARWVLMYQRIQGTVFGGVYASSNTIAEPLTTAGTWYQVTNLLKAAQGNGITINEANSRLQVISDGYYECMMSASFSGTANATFKMAIFTNGMAAENLFIERKLSTGGDIGDSARTSFLWLPTNCIVDLRVTSDGAGDTATVRHGGFKVLKLP